MIKDPSYKKTEHPDRIVCEECGAFVHIEFRNTHDRFHRTLQIIDQESARLSRAATRSSRR